MAPDTPRPAPEAPTSWLCPMCSYYMDGQVCTKCGNPHPVVALTHAATVAELVRQADGGFHDLLATWHDLAYEAGQQNTTGDIPTEPETVAETAAIRDQIAGMFAAQSSRLAEREAENLELREAAESGLALAEEIYRSVEGHLDPEAFEEDDNALEDWSRRMETIRQRLSAPARG